MMAIPIILFQGDVLVTISIGSLHIASVPISTYIMAVAGSFLLIALISVLALNGAGPSVVIKITAYVAIWLTLTEILETVMAYALVFWNILYVLLTSLYGIGLVISTSGQNTESD
jgi:hypothetical protein